MNAQQQFCSNPDCPDYSKMGAGNICIHSRKEQRYRCSTCGKTFAATHDTPLYRRHYDHQIYAWVISLLGHGCPKAAIVFTFGLDPRTVDDRWRHSGQHGQKVHQALVLQPRELIQVQVEEVRQEIRLM